MTYPALVADPLPTTELDVLHHAEPDYSTGMVLHIRVTPTDRGYELD